MPHQVSVPARARPRLQVSTSVISSPGLYPQIGRAVPKPIESAAGGDVFDIGAGHADIQQLSLTQVVQGCSQPITLASLLKRAPASPEQVQDTLRRCRRRSGSL